LNIGELLNKRREHIKRFANENGAAGEISVLAEHKHFVARPRKQELKNLLQCLKDFENIEIKGTSFDAIELPNGVTVDFKDMESIKSALPKMIFTEIKTANQKRVKEDFQGFFFAFTEGEIEASEKLKGRHQVLLVNKKTKKMRLTSVPYLLGRSKSKTWQLSVQL
jgi:hypothetical protein